MNQPRMLPSSPRQVSLPQIASFNFSSAANIKQDIVDSTQPCRGINMTDDASSSPTVAE